jgi:hypothetical protein
MTAIYTEVEFNMVLGYWQQIVDDGGQGSLAANDVNGMNEATFHSISDTLVKCDVLKRVSKHYILSDAFLGYLLGLGKKGEEALLNHSLMSAFIHARRVAFREAIGGEWNVVKA